MERNLKIKLNKQFSVRGRFFGSLDKPLVIIVHGMPGNYREGFYMNAARWFVKNGYSAFGFNLYDWHKDARQLMDCTLAVHAADLDKVVEYFRKKGVNKIFVVGHSYGGPTILLSHEQAFNGAALWDPSQRIAFAKNGTFVKPINGYVMDWGSNYVIGKAMVDEADRLDWDNLAAMFYVPLKIIAAGKGVLLKGAQRSFNHANNPKALDVVEGATHYFDDKEDMQEEVFALTKEWFDKY